jgi:flagellar motor switch protein FliM
MSGDEGNKRKTIRPVDFRLPRSFERSQLRALELLLETAVRPAATLMGGVLRRSVKFDIAGTDQLAWESVLAENTHAALVITFGLPPLASRAVIHVPAKAALAVLDLRLGGEGEIEEDEDDEEEERTLTELEQSLLSSVFKDLIDHLAQAISTHVQVHPDRIHPEPSLEFVQAIPLSEMCVLIKLTMTIGEEITTQVDFIFPYSMLRPVVDLMVNRSVVAEPSDDGFQSSLAARLLDVPVVTRVRFAPTKIASDVVLKLKQGDVIPLNHRQGKPLSVVVDRVEVFKAAIGQSGSRVAAVILGEDGDGAKH